MIILISLGMYLHLYNPTPIPLKMDLKEFPSMIGEWRLVRTEYPKNPYGVPDADIELMNVYQNKSGREIKLYIAYFKSQTQGKEVIHYRTQWLHKEAETVKIHINPHGNIRVSKTIFKDRKNNELLLFWYDFNGRIVNSRYEAKIFTVLDGFFRGRTNGALIIVSKNLEDRDRLKEIINSEVEFAQELLPVLQSYLPSP